MNSVPRIRGTSRSQLVNAPINLNSKPHPVPEHLLSPADVSPTEIQLAAGLSFALDFVKWAPLPFRVGCGTARISVFDNQPRVNSNPPFRSKRHSRHFRLSPQSVAGVFVHTRHTMPEEACSWSASHTPSRERTSDLQRNRPVVFAGRNKSRCVSAIPIEAFTFAARLLYLFAVSRISAANGMIGWF